MGPGEGPEHVLLEAECLDVRVGHRTYCGQALGVSRRHIAGSGEADHGTQPSCSVPGFNAMSAPQGEVHDLVSVGGQDAARAFGGDGGLVVEYVGFNQLGLRKRRSDFQQGFAGQHDAPFGLCPYLITEFQAEQWCQILGPSSHHRGEDIHVIRVHTIGGKEVEDGFQTGTDKKAPVRRQVAHEQTERRRTGHALAQVRLGHRDLVEVGARGIRHRRHLPALNGSRAWLPSPPLSVSDATWASQAPGGARRTSCCRCSRGARHGCGPAGSRPSAGAALPSRLTPLVLRRGRGRRSEGPLAAVGIRCPAAAEGFRSPVE